MKKLFIFDEVVYQGDIKKDFRFYWVRKSKNLNIILNHAILKFKKIFKIIGKDEFENKYWAYLNEVHDLDKVINDFWIAKNKKINKLIVKEFDDNSILVTDCPTCLFENSMFKQVVGNDYLILESKFVYFKSVSQITKNLIKDDDIGDIYTNKVLKNKSFTSHVLNGKKIYTDLSKLKKKKALGFIWNVLIILLISIGLTLISLHFATGTFGEAMFNLYLENFELVFLNFLPILLLLIFMIAVTNRLWTGYTLTTIIILTLTLINHFKLVLRDDPFIYADIKLFSESIMMSGKYTIQFSNGMIMMFVFAFMGIFVIKFISNLSFHRKSTRISFILIPLLIMIMSYYPLFVNADVYNSFGDNPLANQWSSTQQFISRGFIYPFIHSINDSVLEVPEGYSESKAKEILYEYSYDDIAEDKKVNVISIMLEAYNDFSKFDSLDFKEDVYRSLHRIQEESYHGNLVTNIFAGGTINSEHSFLSGYSKLTNFRNDTNSHVRYFNEQGYTTEGSHPMVSWFYNRKNVNEFLGFQNYYFEDNRYKMMDGDYAKDNLFFEDILSLYNSNKKTGKPYFNYSLTYQNHGPYDDEKISGKQYLNWKDEYNESDFNIINNYFNGVNDTSEQLIKLIDTLRNDSDPVVLIFFGDHNPWLGNNNSVYDMAKIDLNIDHVEGFLNYYTTPYVIWANDVAKEVLDNEFVGNGPDLSPNFLMNEFFNLAGYSGNEFIKASNYLKESVSVLHSEFSNEDGMYSKKLSKEAQKRYDDYRIVEYYYETNLIKK